ncbi:MAG: DoxX family protein [Candidatus Zambryskibacteria bacterium]|nr:DoxX family protein [Candidatus Zambryskibacteria bacterium]
MNRDKLMNITMFLLRVVSGLLFMQHGGTKLFGWFGGIPGGELPTLMLVAGILEFFGGLAILFGFLTRPIAFILSGEMAVAYFQAHYSIEAVWPIENGGEPAVLFSFIFLFFAAHGAGMWSIDAWLKSRRRA